MRLIESRFQKLCRSHAQISWRIRLDLAHMRTGETGLIPIDLIWGTRDSRVSRSTRTSGTLSDLTLTALRHFPCRLICRWLRTSSALVISESGTDAPFQVIVVAERPMP